MNGWTTSSVQVSRQRSRNRPGLGTEFASANGELKGPLARLENELARNAWSGDAGTGRLDYRWGKVQTIVLDILRPLAAEAGDA